MPYSYAIEERLVLVAWYGVVGPEDLAAFGREMPEIGRGLGFAPDMIHSFAGVTETVFEPAGIFEYSQRQRLIPMPNPCRVAMVVTTKSNEYLVNVFKTFNHTPNLEMKVFRDEATARRWIARKDG